MNFGKLVKYSYSRKFTLSPIYILFIKLSLVPVTFVLCPHQQSNRLFSCFYTKQKYVHGRSCNTTKLAAYSQALLITVLCLWRYGLYRGHLQTSLISSRSNGKCNNKWKIEVRELARFRTAKVFRTKTKSNGINVTNLTQNTQLSRNITTSGRIISTFKSSFEATNALPTLNKDTK